MRKEDGENFVPPLSPWLSCNILYCHVALFIGFVNIRRIPIVLANQIEYACFSAFFGKLFGLANTVEFA